MCFQLKNIIFVGMHTWTHKETIVAKVLLASLKPLGAISTHLHPMEDPLYDIQPLKNHVYTYIKNK